VAMKLLQGILLTIRLSLQRSAVICRPAHKRFQMRLVLATRQAVGALTACVLMAIAFNARAQDIEPRAYSNAPVGVNFLVAGYGYTQGGLPSDPALPITNDNLNTSSAFLGYARALGLRGKSGIFQVVVPYMWLSGSADFAGKTVPRVVNGFTDPLVRLSINFYGAPALRLKEFSKYKQNWIVGAAVRVSAPLGQYDESRLINIGVNRWVVRPELGASKAAGQWTLEISAGPSLYTHNKEFFGGHTRSQRPLYSSQAHAIYSFPKGIWASLDATYFTGGQSTIDGIRSDDFQRNWRAGATLALPVDIHNSIKLYASHGVSARTGNNFDLIGIAWQYRWGGGL
jgi:outer membrane putative beta-barrel porin/alpha-amylase